MFFVSGLVNIETNLKVAGFPIEYFPIDYPFFKINTDAAGVGINICKALAGLNDEVRFLSIIGKDEEGERIKRALAKEGIDTGLLEEKLEATPQSVVLYDETGKREIYCDLKDIQEQTVCTDAVSQIVKNCELIVLCNINYNRELLKTARKMGKIVATDVHVLEEIEDEYNRDFIAYSDILFLSDEKLPLPPEKFLMLLQEKYPHEIIVLGQGEKGAMIYIKEEEAVYQIGAVKVRPVVNTVGAGDALFSGFLHFYMKGLKPLEAAKRAVIFAAYKIGENGAARGFAAEEKVEALAKETNFNIHKIEV